VSRGKGAATAPAVVSNAGWQVGGVSSALQSEMDVINAVVVVIVGSRPTVMSRVWGTLEGKMDVQQSTQ
jgi:hypothetical protein